MTIKIVATISAVGEEFSPSAWEKKSGIECTNKIEAGTIQNWGRYAGAPLPYGTGNFQLNDKESIEILDCIDQDFWSKISRIVADARSLQATDIDFDFKITYEDQCNFWFSSDVLGQIHRLGIPITISCYEGKVDLPHDGQKAEIYKEPEN